MKSVIRVLIIGLAIGLTSCSSIRDAFNPPPPITEGDVVDMSFEAEHWESGYRTEHYTDCGYSNRYNYTSGEYEYSYGCEPATRQVYESHHEWVEDTWKIQIDGCVDYEREGENRRHCDTRWITVDEDAYDDYRIGIHYPHPE